jgi:dihydrofolate reductase
MPLHIIAAIARNRVIGRQGKLPWDLPEDRRRFRELTWGHPVLMGRRTLQEVIDRLGSPLPGRRTLLISRRGTPLHPDVDTYPSLAKAIASFQDSSGPIFVAGGAQLYAAALPLADILDLTRLDATVEGDAVFPVFEPLLERQFQRTVAIPQVGYSFERWERMTGFLRPNWSSSSRFLSH